MVKHAGKLGPYIVFGTSESTGKGMFCLVVGWMTQVKNIAFEIEICSEFCGFLKAQNLT